nr:MAG TPA: hypothetical protein [Caudoviricetes sp.]
MYCCHQFFVITSFFFPRSHQWERWQAVAVGVSLRTRAFAARFIFDAAKVLHIIHFRKYFGKKNTAYSYYLTFGNN